MKFKSHNNLSNSGAHGPSVSAEQTQGENQDQREGSRVQPPQTNYFQYNPAPL